MNGPQSKLELLAGMARSLGALERDEPLLETLVGGAARVFGAERVTFFEARGGRLEAVLGWADGGPVEPATARAARPLAPALGGSADGGGLVFDGRALELPISYGGRLLGVLELLGPDLAVGPEDRPVLELLAAQAGHALAIRDASAVAARERRKARALASAGRTVARSLDPEGVLGEVLQLVRGELGVSRCAILLVDRGTQDLVLRHAVGYGVGSGTRIPVEQGITGRVVRGGEATLVSDVLMDPDYVPGVPGGRSEMAAPLVVEGEVVGVLDVESTEPGAFEPWDLELLEALASQVASAVRNAELHEKAEKRARRMGLLNEAGRALTEVLVPDVLLGQILRLARDALSFSHCAVLLLDDESGDLVVRAALGYGEIVGKRIPRGRGISAEVVATGRAVLVPDVLGDHRYVPGVAGGRTEIVAPIVIDGSVVGTLDAESPEVSAYDEDDLELLAAFAAQAGAALRNARLLDRLEQRSARLSIIHRVSQAMSTVLDPVVVLDEVLRLARGALAFSRSAIALVQPGGDELVVRAAIGYGDIVGKRIPLAGSISGEAVRTGEPVLVEDVRKDARYVEGSAGARCEMVAPLKVRGEVIGILDAEAERVGAFSRADLELLSVFAVHAATAIHNSRLFRRLEDANAALRANLTELERLNGEVESSACQIRSTNDQLERQVRQLEALHEAGQAMTASLDLDSTLQAILRMTRDLMQASMGTIKLMDEETHEMRVRASAGSLGIDERCIDLPLRVGDRVIGMFELASTRQLGAEEQRLLETLASQAAVAIENARLFEDTQRTYYETLKSLASALEARDTYTRGHSERVARLSVRIAERLGLGEEDRREIYSAALLHDIGKIGVRDDILLKPASLTEEEMAVIRSHPELGDAILGPLKFLGRVSSMVRHHHERWDGGGYPEGIGGETIPLPSRIVAVADAYDALTSDRPYRGRKTHDEALGEIRRGAGSQFDPGAVEALLALLG